jgi:SAM-dependent methyltransferase
MSRARNYFAWQARLIRPALGRRVVEVGCGTGNFTATILDRELVIATDIEAACVERLRARFPDQPNLKALVCSPEDPLFADLAQLRPDCCVCLNVLEHIADDVNALRRMAGILPSGGVVALWVPAFPALYGPVDRNLEHYRRYTPASLRKAAEAAGLVVESQKFVNAVGFLGWWANARLFRREAQSARQIAIFDRYVVPIVSRLERVAPPPFGQSLMAVLRKS